jgi:hypothetical protein
MESEYKQPIRRLAVSSRLPGCNYMFWTTSVILFMFWLLEISVPFTAGGRIHILLRDESCDGDDSDHSKAEGFVMGEAKVRMTSYRGIAGLGHYRR